MDQQKRKELTKTAIENAGIECFANRSFDSVTMTEIAKKSGYTKRTVYNYFPSKSALIASIFGRKLKELYDLEQEALDGCATAHEAIFVHFTVLNRFTQENYGFMRMFWALSRDINKDEASQNVLADVVFWNRKLIDLPASVIEKCGLTGKLAEYSPVVIVHYISALNKGLALQHDKENSLSLMDVTIQDLTSFGLELLLNNL